MSPPYIKCPTCGSHLDPGERCTCNGKKEEAPKSVRKRRQAPYRVETCRECGLDWNVSVLVKTPPSGYLCPRCKERQKKGAKT